MLRPFRLQIKSGKTESLDRGSRLVFFLRHILDVSLKVRQHATAVAAPILGNLFIDRGPLHLIHFFDGAMSSIENGLR